MFAGLWICTTYADAAQHLKAAVYDLDDVDDLHDPGDLNDQDDLDHLSDMWNTLSTITLSQR